jgi:hypothetical protein
MLPIRSFFLVASLALITTPLASQEHHAAAKCVSYQIGVSHPLAPYTFHAGF